MQNDTFFCFIVLWVILDWCGNHSMRFSISATISLIFTSSATAIRYSVSSVGFRDPRSIALKCVLPISASPLSTSCETPFRFRKSAMTFPTKMASNVGWYNLSPLSYHILEIQLLWIHMLIFRTECGIISEDVSDSFEINCSNQETIQYSTCAFSRTISCWAFW